MVLDDAGQDLIERHVTAQLREVAKYTRGVGAEVKASMTVNVHDFRHLSFARDRLGDQFITGVVFYTGARALPFGDRLMALPINLPRNGQPVSGL